MQLTKEEIQHLEQQLLEEKPRIRLARNSSAGRLFEIFFQHEDKEPYTTPELYEAKHMLILFLLEAYE